MEKENILEFYQQTSCYTDLGLGSLWVRDVVYTRDKIANLLGTKT